MNRLLAATALLVASMLLTACGDSGVGPSDPTAPRLTGISPTSGTTFGGTPITITGVNFASGATVTIGGAAATDVAVASATTITATTPPHASGTADVVVVVNGKRGALSAGYSFVTPGSANTPPTINSIVVKGSGPREPAQFASLDETVAVTASVSDAETDVSKLTFAWSSDLGTFTGTGPTVTWTAPHTLPTTPVTVTLKVTVTEQYLAPDPTGLPVPRQNVVSRTSDVRVHDSVKEVGDMAYDFLVAFSKQLNPDIVMRNFTSTCSDAAGERSDVEANQRTFKITDWAVGTPVTTVDFTGTCPYRDALGDACARVGVRWTSTTLATKQSGTTSGFDQVSAVLENDQWRLCGSYYDATVASGLSLGFKR